MGGDINDLHLILELASELGLNAEGVLVVVFLLLLPRRCCWSLYVILIGLIGRRINSGCCGLLLLYALGSLLMIILY